ncbi:MAG: TnsA endonuclease N-terminal domain-containing protein [Acinetobacter populi]|jgi:hypothetical protein|uniref:TnsA endonuclease N-terminal domain-containing protein n=1 Tax=Acinetobacter populi TaxID=1582270 RepID=UPI00235639E8|nr:TnsA endonuclease N-terminal domain-containing protein [Acinetobacter populi]MCH4247667.1 TnsA endonuclease N-terminal domain-containing protein [Acinetobacter populi]
MYKSVRKIGPTRRSVSGYYSFKNTHSIPYESSLERDFIMLHEFDDNVTEIISQPVSIPFALNGCNYQYHPDFLVLFQNCTKSGMLVEVKPESEWREHWWTWRTKWKAAARWAKERNFLFHIYDESRIRGQELKNIKTLHSFKRAAFNEQEINEACHSINSSGMMSVADYLDQFPIEQQARQSQLLWQLLAKRILVTDLSLPLNKSSMIEVSQYGR